MSKVSANRKAGKAGCYKHDCEHGFHRVISTRDLEFRRARALNNLIHGICLEEL